MKRKAGLLAALVLVLTLGPMWAFVLDEIKHERTLTVQAARNNAMNLATAFEAHVLSTIRLMDIVLLDMREDVLEHMDFGRHVDEELKAYGGFIAQLAVIDRDGRLVFSNLGPSGKHVDLSDREHFRVHRDNPQEDRLFISKPVLGRVSKQWTIQFTRPIHQNGEFAGVLVLSVPTSFFADYYQQIDVGPNGSIVLLGTDRSVRAIASGTQIPGRYGRFKVPEDKPYFDPEAPQRGFYEGVSVIDGEYRLGAYRRLIDQGVVVVVLLSPTDFMAAFQERKTLLTVSAGVISLALSVVALLIFLLSSRYFQSIARLRLAHGQLAQLANTDVLTGVSSRRAFLAGLEAELARARRHNESLSLLMLDIDHFKRVNGVHGHPIGDAVLKQFSETCAGMLRAHDLFGRLGGEEFAIVLPHTDTEGARCVAEKIRTAVAQTPMPTAAGDITVTVSIGLAQMEGLPGEVDQLMARADQALYEAKRGGRNQVRG
ncbi:diguanylate cyclase [Pseudomonas stutzeri]|uniref:diguanylate cyclase n=1 Tax=Stutzerimonas stutzeri TaxID=316 RepID=A0AA42P8I0_STUST|nr:MULTISPECIES: diguanylate cyclase [Stutzerimonas]MCF0015565.1 diguanylate cyclase [Stutzerimonas stutzeri]MCF0018839.1 diguanylate cyclase [Stutzerimonas stutzeri]MDH1236716.1 diguanylate cyclase [Stutzerimonas stutzeri]MDL2172892.1 diguanylate cyclase [Stutzerimonas sp. FeSN7]